ncbi:MAG: hypothetical protein ACOC04_02840 [Halothece sp.]
MTSDRQFGQIKLWVNASNPNLLAGLDSWISLGLISEGYVKQLCQQHLSCPLPTPVEVFQPPERELIPAVSQPHNAVFAEEKEEKREEKPSIVGQVLQSFKEELSVRWLLFLGVFLVVVSSAVLAATQWERFPAAGQYGVLWAYTIVFWGVGFWAHRKDNLQLTAQTLQTITLLLIPVNFWAIATFGLWRYPWEWVTVAIAFLTLSTIPFTDNRLTQKRPILFAYLGLSYLHLGWAINDFAILALYIATIGIVIATLSPPRQLSGFGIYALSVLLIRAIFVEQLPIAELGLVIGVFGWLLTQLAHTYSINLPPPNENLDTPETTESPIPKAWLTIGLTLLFIGWIVSVEQVFPWEAVVISLLGFWVFTQRLQRHWLRRDLAAIFLIGLQTYYLCGRLIPLSFRQDAITTAAEITNTQSFPAAILSVSLFPYLIFFVALTGWLSQQSKPKLARFGEGLTLGLGIVLTLISLSSPSLRSLNLILSTATLAFVTQKRQPFRIPLVYLTHVIGLSAIASIINSQFRNLDVHVWATLLLIVMIIEWGLFTLQSPSSTATQEAWYLSCWHIGFILAGISYLLFTISPNEWALLWLLTPLTLTGVATRRFTKRIPASWLSISGLIIAQLLIFVKPETRLIGLGLASVLMIVNTRYLCHSTAALIHVAFGLSFIAALLENTLSLTLSAWAIVGAIATLILWIISQSLTKRDKILTRIYSQATDRWAIALSTLIFSLLTLQTVAFYTETAIESFNSNGFIAALLITTAIIYRYRKQPNEVAIWGISWGIEITVSELVLLANGNILDLATANICLGIATLPITLYLAHKNSRYTPFTSLKFLPLFYGILGILFRLNTFKAYTGLLTLGAAITGIGVGYRQTSNKSISYLSLIGISIACYEIVIYQMLQASGGSSADGLTILAIVASAIALTYRLFAWFWQLKGKRYFLNFRVTEIITFAHIHWAIASILKLATFNLALETAPRLTPISLTLGFFLGVYAVIQGRNSQPREGETASDWWIYIGLIEILGTTIYARLIFTQLSVLDPWRILLACLIALLIYQLPWWRLNWHSTPWKRAAVVLPTLSVFATLTTVSSVSLLVVAVFYIQLAYRQSKIQWTYLSLVFIDWAIALSFEEYLLTDPLWYALITGLSILYIAQVDPNLKQSKVNRHYLRTIAIGIICLTALLFHNDTGLIPATISLGIIILGIASQIRAFLFVGTITFILTGVYQLIILIVDYPFTKWILGLIAGILFISIAANFEQRREQMITAVQNWITQLNQWQ